MPIMMTGYGRWAGMHVSARRYNINYYVLKRAQWQNNNNNLPSFEPKQDPKDGKSFVAAPLRDSLSRPLRSSSFGRDARWNLDLGSRFTNLENRKKKGKKKSNSRKLSAHGRPTIINDCCSFTCTISSATFVSKANRDRDRGNLKNRWTKAETSGMLHSFPILFSSIFQIWFPETGCHAKTRLPEIRDCDNLPGPTYLI